MACSTYGTSVIHTFADTLANITFCSYDLPHRLHTSKIYPVASPNGSTIIVYGHEQGLRLVWRGGRPFKEDQELPQGKQMSNGASQDVVVIEDSSDEEAKQDTPFVDTPIFQDDEAEYNPTEPFEPLIQVVDLSMGVEVLGLSFPRLPADLYTSSLPPLLKEKLLIAAACSDGCIRVICASLAPPSPRSKAEARRKVPNLTAGSGSFGEQITTLSSGTTHQSIPQGVSIAMTARSPEDSDDVDMEDEDDTAKRLPSSSRHTSRSRSHSRLGKDQIWDLLVASHSADLSGLLLIHRIPLAAEGASISTEMHIPWRKQYLSSPAVSVEFSSALYPSSRHSQLLVAEAKGSVRLYDCLPRSQATQGSWIVSLHTEFEASQNLIPKRRSILDAKWILGGKGIMVLQADGQWGIWNHEGRGPTSADNRFSGFPTTFALNGWVASSLKPKPLLKSSSTKSEPRSKLAPMTPGTRKMKQEALFTGPPPVSDGPTHGGISVVPIRDSTSNQPDDESILIWHGTTAIVIPSIFTHWQNKLRGSGNLFGIGAKGEPKTISNIHLGGESINEINLLPPRQLTNPSKNEKDSAQPAVLVTGEKRLVFIAPPLQPLEAPATAAAAAASPPSFSRTSDQQMLAKGELDVNGMDRILAGMSNGHPRPSRRNSQASNKARSLLLSR